jgi:sodium/pantothenate symporter
MEPTSEVLHLVTSSDGATGSALVTFGIYLLFVFFLAWLSSWVRTRKEFVSEYFLGSRGLGVWAFALTFAATNASGGSFMGFPALIYTHGWVLALWIASYMVVPIVTTGLLAKRLNQVARRAGAVTVPEILRERFGSPAVGLIATGLLTFFMFFYLLAQFKAGSSILATLLGDIPGFQSAVAGVAVWQTRLPWLESVQPDYLLCLIVFAGTVIAYTAYGGFRAVVWTDVMQGIVMVLGVGIMLFLILQQTGGLTKATRAVAEMTPPEHGAITLRLVEPVSRDVVVRKGTWLEVMQGEERISMVRTKELVRLPAGETESTDVPVIISTTPSEIASIEADELALTAEVEITSRTPYEYGAGQRGAYVSAPGPSPGPNADMGFLSIGMALSFFIFWSFGGAGQPSNMVRQMAFRDSLTLRRSIMMVSGYYSLIYFPLVIIFCCARLIVPGMEVEPDRVMPETARVLAAGAGAPWLAGLIVAAPFAAVMSSVDSFLLMVSSGLVRDIYQRNINPNVSERKMKVLTYLVTTVVGIAAALAVLNPPQYLQNLIVFSTGGLAGCFFIPMALTLFWPRMTRVGIIAGMLGGCGTHLALYLAGYWYFGTFKVYALLGLEAFIWDMVGATVCSVVGSRVSRPLPRELVAKFFGTASVSELK